MESESSASYVPPRSFSSAKFAYPAEPINYDFEPIEAEQAGNKSLEVVTPSNGAHRANDASSCIVQVDYLIARDQQCEDA